MPNSKAQSYYYLDEFLRLRCLEDIHPVFQVGRAAKEITESFGMYMAARDYLFQPINHLTPEGHKFDKYDPNTTVVVIGDGATPRTAAMFAFLTKWQCFSIDPAMRDDDSSWSHIKNLTVLKEPYQNIKFETEHPLLIVLPHAHVNAAEILSLYKSTAKRTMITMPCCSFQKQTLPLSHYLGASVYYDKHILSPHNLIYIYHNV